MPAASAPHAKRSATPAWTSLCTSPTLAALPADSPPRTFRLALGALRGRAMRPPPKLARSRLLRPDRRPARRQPSLSGSRAQTAQAQLPHPARTRRGGPAARMNVVRCAQPSITPMHRGQLPACSCRHPPVDGLHRPSGRTASPNTPSTIMSPILEPTGSRTKIRLGVRAHPTRTNDQPHAPPVARLDI